MEEVLQKKNSLINEIDFSDKFLNTCRITDSRLLIVMNICCTATLHRISLVSKLHILRLLPCPSARTKYFLSWTISKLSKTKILSRVKSPFFAFKSHLKQNFVIGNLFSTTNIHFAWLLKAKNGLFNPGQNFCPGQFEYCPGQKIFCPGRWTRH